MMNKRKNLQECISSTQSRVANITKGINRYKSEEIIFILNTSTCNDEEMKKKPRKTHICFPAKISLCCRGGMPSFSSTRSLILSTLSVGSISISSCKTSRNLHQLQIRWPELSTRCSPPVFSPPEHYPPRLG